MVYIITMKKSKPVIDFDSAWKDAIQLFFESFLELLFPQIHHAKIWKTNYHNDYK